MREKKGDKMASNEHWKQIRDTTQKFIGIFDSIFEDTAKEVNVVTFQNDQYRITTIIMY